MLISAMMSSTGSFVHYNGKDSFHKIRKDFSHLLNAHLVDFLVGLFVQIFGYLSFTRFAPGCARQLPRCVKITLITGGMGLIVVDALYFANRYLYAYVEYAKHLKVKITTQWIDDPDLLPKPITKVIEEMQETKKRILCIKQIVASVTQMKENIRNPEFKQKITKLLLVLHAMQYIQKLVFSSYYFDLVEAHDGLDQTNFRALIRVKSAAELKSL